MKKEFEFLNVDSFRELGVFSADQNQKSSLILPALRELTFHHYKNSDKYKKIIDLLNPNFISLSKVRIDQIPFLPTRIFKSNDLQSRKDKSTFMIRSSGTTSLQQSRVAVDQETSHRQSIALICILQDFIGKEKLPMLIFDSDPANLRNDHYTARSAGILGFAKISKSRKFALDHNLELNIDAVFEFIQKNIQDEFFCFGFTAIVWEKVISVLEHKEIRLPKNKGILFHGGGWKRLEEKSGTSSDAFRKSIKSTLGISRIHDYYGMAEQAGSIFVQCNFGYFHTSVFSEVIIRDPFSFRPLGINQEGLIQVLSVLPLSYPGHSLLTEDKGILVGIDDCGCGRLGRYFIVIGRLAQSDIRGCSDATIF